MDRHSHAHHSDRHGHGHGHTDHGHDESGLAEMLDLDAEVLGSFLDDLTEWAARRAPAEVHLVADIGAGTGTGTLALARRFPDAGLAAIDRSAVMLDRVRVATAAAGLGDRVRTIRADLDAAWPDLDSVDVAWAALAMHEVSDPDRVLADVRAALNPGGLLVVVEMEGFPRFLPDDLGFGRTGLEARCHAALLRAGWNAHPDWREHLEAAGFEVADQRTFAIECAATPNTARYASTFLRRARGVLAETRAADDLAALDRVLGDGPDGLAGRADLTVRGSRTAWAALRPR
ncbi:class I SAM-dependent methyltransferase [Rhodococcus sp. NPDC058505]|uniref:class I SAM-dependent methyltransferase n=1 Tax=unclassified Rhodococcus (in: high G+C Gram-positive bacteria) TaxID=192944 RepID=UPI003668D3B5